MLILRLIASPTLDAATVDALRHFGADSLLACASDAEVNATFFSVHCDEGAMTATARRIAESVGPSQSSGRAFRLELQHDDPAEFFSDDVLRSVAVDVHGVLRCSIFIAKRSVPVSNWAQTRPMGWGAAGLALGGVAPALPFGGSESVGLAIEAGARTMIAKAKLAGVLDAVQLHSMAAAVGGPDSGFVDVGAYALGGRKDGSSILVLELGDCKRTPLHRVLDVLDIEAARFGVRLGLGSLLSDAPLEVFTGALQSHMGLLVAQNQIIETHLAGAVAQH